MHTPHDPVTIHLLGHVADTIATACHGVRHVRADAPPGWWPEGAWGGHLDIARELTDGGVFDYS